MDKDPTGTEERCGILVAADGASSKIRASMRPGDKLQFSRAVQMSGAARERRDMLLLTRGSRHTRVGAECLETAPNPRRDNCRPREIQGVLRQAKELGKDIAEPFKLIIDATDTSSVLVLNAMGKRPSPHDMKTDPVIFIGDAYHAFAGNGANLALKDGWDLAEQLCQFSSLACAVAAYDK
ncbi:hypothetical protein O1611_g8322 [Lasiodiplodia mahajangana]|uniref:Uncharacterized protein n=1 Tax=Lasiodiplodia mahajangana TaxID=1108764 RepID=A0ACC2JCR8_9PEZI|nr:hypothetical protein O1611_g8322 [Lasiodiplodia mahajangana]